MVSSGFPPHIRISDRKYSTCWIFTIRDRGAADVLPSRFSHSYTFFQMLTQKNLYLSHNFWNLTLKQQKHTPNLQIHTLILGLWLSFQRLQFATVCNVRQMFAFEMCLWYCECSAAFCKWCEAFCILCVQFLDLCVKQCRYSAWWVTVDSVQFNKCPCSKIQLGCKAFLQKTIVPSSILIQFKFYSVSVQLHQYITEKLSVFHHN